jgi:hypothetical protein
LPQDQLGPKALADWVHDFAETLRIEQMVIAAHSLARARPSVQPRFQSPVKFRGLQSRIGRQAVDLFGYRLCNHG